MSRLEKPLHLPESAYFSSETAVHRVGPSIPARFLVENGLINGPIFDWGCGRGADLTYFHNQGISAVGWDPVHFPFIPPESYLEESFSWVTCSFVLNTLESPTDRIEVIQKIKKFLLSEGHLALTVRSQSEINSAIKSTWKKSGDGWITSKGTFQKDFTPKEIQKLLKPFFSEIEVVSLNPLMVISSSPSL